MILLNQKIKNIYTTNLRQPFIKWSDSNFYQANDMVLYNNYIYRSIVDNNNGVQPDLNTGKWLLFGVDNAYAAIDLNSSTSAICDDDTNTLTGRNDLQLKFSAFGFSNIGINGLLGRELIIEEQDATGAILSTTTYDITQDRVNANEWYEYYFFPAPSNINDIKTVFYEVQNLATVAYVNILITEHGSGISSVQSIVGGVSVPLGETQYSPRISLLDYSIKETDDYGITTLQRRKSREVLDFDIVIAAEETQRVKREIRASLGTVNLFVGDEDPDGKYEHLAILGYVSDFSILIDNGVISRGILKIEEVL